MANRIGKKVGKRIRTLRHKQGLTLEQVANACGLLPEAVGRAERGAHAPSLRTLERIGRALGVRVTDLLGDWEMPIVSSEGIPARARGVAMMLADQDDAVIAKAHRMVAILIEK